MNVNFFESSFFLVLIFLLDDCGGGLAPVSRFMILSQVAYASTRTRLTRDAERTGAPHPLVVVRKVP